VTHHVRIDQLNQITTEFIY